MKPELTENTTFQRYYEKWQKDPTSVVFAAISEIFRNNNMVDDAIKIAKEGLKYHPNLVSGRLALAKAYLAVGDKILATEQAKLVLQSVPENLEAKKICEETLKHETISQMIEEYSNPDEEITEDMPIELANDNEEDEAEEMVADSGVASANPAWHTLTMARILKSQGHIDQARYVYQRILEREPDNSAVKEELESL